MKLHLCFDFIKSINFFFIMNQNYFTIRSPNRITAFNSLCPPESKVMLREIIRRKREKSSS